MRNGPEPPWFRARELAGIALMVGSAVLIGLFQRELPPREPSLRLLFSVEDTLLEVGDLQSDFALVVARPRPVAASRR